MLLFEHLEEFGMIGFDCLVLGCANCCVELRVVVGPAAPTVSVTWVFWRDVVVIGTIYSLLLIQLI